MNVLSLFDGCSGGQQALERSGHKVDKYFASEIDKYAIQVTMANYPNTIQLGSVIKVSAKTICLSEVYSYLCKKYFNNDIHSLQSIIPEWEMLHRINKKQNFTAYFGTQIPNEEQKTQSNPILSINDRIWFWKCEMGNNTGVYDIIRSGNRRKESNKIDVGELCKHSFWWNGNGQSEFGTEKEGIERFNGEECNGTNKTKDSRSSNKTIFNSSIERESEIISNRSIQRPNQEAKLFEWDGKCKQKTEVNKEERNGREKKTSEIFKDEGNIQTNYEINGTIEIDRVFVPVYSDTQITIIECEWGIIIFNGTISATLGGSPCQSFSFAGKRKGMSTKDEQEILTLDHYLQLKSEGFEFEGQSYLFWEYMRILTELRTKNPNVYFLLENVEMGEKWEKVLSQAIGVNGIHINSALVSAQNRKRIYWCNFGMRPMGLFGDLESIIEQPKDRGILLKDILESEVNEKYFLSEKMINWLDKHSEKRNVDVKKLDGEQKSATITSTALMKGNLSTDYIMHSTFGRTSTNGNGGSGHLSKEGDKSYCLDVANSMAVEIVLTNKDKRLQKIVDDNTFIDGEVAHLDTYNQTIDKDKSPALKLPHNDRFIFAPTKSTNTVEIREVKQISTNNKSNGGTQPYQQDRIYDVNGISPALSAGKSDLLITSGTLRTHKDGEGFREVQSGKGATVPARAREDGSGQNVVMITSLNENQEKKFNPNINSDKANALTLAQGRAGSSDEYMDSVSKIANITSRIRRLTPVECERLQTVADNYTKHVSDSQRYKMLGNGWNIETIAHLFSYLPKQ